jgi:hypothetical protein
LSIREEGSAVTNGCIMNRKIIDTDSEIKLGLLKGKGKGHPVTVQQGSRGQVEV